MRAYFHRMNVKKPSRIPAKGSVITVGKRNKKYDFGDYGKKGNTKPQYTSSYADSSTKRRKSYTEKQQQKKIALVVACTIGILALVAVGFVGLDTLLEISNRPTEPTTLAPITQAPSTQEPGTSPAATPVPTVTIRAQAYSSVVLRGGNALETCIGDAQSAGVSAVMIDFKDATGALSYASALEIVQTTGAAKNGTANAKESIAQLQKAGIAVIARICCFQDSTAPSKMRVNAVWYNAQGTLWLDASKAAGGKPWLNPYAEGARDYLTQIIAEVRDLGVDYILLDAVQFPNGSLSHALFNGENAEGAPSRNEQLLEFLEQAKQSAGNVPLLCAQNAKKLFVETNSIYDGSLWEAPVAGHVLDIRGATEEQLAQIPTDKRVILLQNDKPEVGEYIKAN